jgi:hypothetical protein
VLYLYQAKRNVLRRLLPILIFILALPISGFGQEKIVQQDEKKNQDKVLKDIRPDKKAEMIKSVPITAKNVEIIRLQNKKATMQQMHTINKAIRKSMTVNKHR